MYHYILYIEIHKYIFYMLYIIYYIILCIIIYINKTNQWYPWVRSGEMITKKQKGIGDVMGLFNTLIALVIK